MASIALVVASLPGRNPGMIAVNEAAIQIFNGMGVGHTLEIFEPARRFEWGPETKELFQPENDFASYDRIVFWGDWLHAEVNTRAYIRLNGSNQSVLDALYLRNLPEGALERVAIVGTTLALDGGPSRASGDYGDATRRLHKHAGLVQMRDSYSAGLVEGWREDRSSCLGVDMAFFFTPQTSVSPSSESLGAEKGAGWYFGRSAEEDVKYLKSFALELSHSLGMRLEGIPWRGGQSPHELAALIRNLKVVITDTYHLAVLSWSLGVPAVLVGGASNSSGLGINMGRRFFGVDKRFALYMSIDAVAYHVPIDDLREKQTLTERVIFLSKKVIGDESYRQSIIDRISQIRRKSYSSLQSFLLS
jgi:hypothetical protein